MTNSSSSIVSDLAAVVGDRYVISKPEDLLVYEYDGSIDRAIPQAVVLPRTAEEVSEVVRIANRHGAYIVARGAGTGLSGGAVPLRDSVVLALTRLTNLIEVDAENRVAIVEPGMINLHLSEQVSHLGLYYAPDPASQKTCTIGGNVGENAGGPHCLALGVTTNHVLGVEVVLADGSLTWFGGSERESTGYDLRGAFVGSEGTLGIVTKVAVRLLPKPEAVHTMLAAFTTMDAASQTVSDVIAAGMVPSALEMMDRKTIDAVEPFYHPGYPADAEAVLIVEVDGLRESVEEQTEQVLQICNANGAMEIREANDEAARVKLWETRKGAIGAYGTISPTYYLVDGVVPRTKLREVLQQVDQIAAELDVTVANVFHAGDGNIHPAILFNERNPSEVQQAILAGARILEACVAAGGALSGEHGIGIEKQAYMPLVFT
ncbi:MAG: FAD-linked oxidase C-terminal domain-containing protein, partial [Dehalococcoidia bacterium]|nr:FAD-linked oxidase C-terminal domain-containing protein [Dehalococcoidia bacterium]